MKQHQKIEINIVSKPPSRIADIVQQITFWTLLVGGVGVSEIWFNGSFVIDIVAVIIAFLSLNEVARRYRGATKTYTRSELKSWVDDGMPGLVGDDVESTR